MQATVLDILMHGHSAAATLGRPGAGPALVVSFLMVLVACLFAGALLRRISVDDPDRRQHLHLCVRDL